MKVTIVDVSLAVDQSGEPRVSLGNVATGKGYASSAPVWGSGDGFIGVPNAADGGQGAPQALMGMMGYTRFALAIRDPRIMGKAGQLAEGDRAIVSNCDAALLLTKSANKIGFVGLPQGMALTLDATNQEIDATVGHARTIVVTSGATMLYDDGVINSFAHATGSGVVLSYTAAAVTCSVTLGPGGRVDIVAPGGVFVNGVPLTVP